MQSSEYTQAVETALQNVVTELENIHREMLAKSPHAPTGCPCTADSGETCPVAWVLDEAREALGQAQKETEA